MQSDASNHDRSNDGRKGRSKARRPIGIVGLALMAGAIGGVIVGAGLWYDGGAVNNETVAHSDNETRVLGQVLNTSAALIINVSSVVEGFEQGTQQMTALTLIRSAQLLEAPIAYLGGLDNPCADQVASGLQTGRQSLSSLSRALDSGHQTEAARLTTVLAGDLANLAEALLHQTNCEQARGAIESTAAALADMVDGWVREAADIVAAQIDLTRSPPVITVDFAARAPADAFDGSLMVCQEGEPHPCLFPFEELVVGRWDAILQANGSRLELEWQAYSAQATAIEIRMTTFAGDAAYVDSCRLVAPSWDPCSDARSDVELDRSSASR